MAVPSISVPDYFTIGLPGFLAGTIVFLALSAACKKLLRAPIDRSSETDVSDEYQTRIYSPRYVDNALLLAATSFFATMETVNPNSKNPSEGPGSAFLALAMLSFFWHFLMRILRAEEYRQIPIALKFSHMALAFRNWKMSTLQSLITLAAATTSVATISCGIFSFK